MRAPRKYTSHVHFCHKGWYWNILDGHGKLVSESNYFFCDEATAKEEADSCLMIFEMFDGLLTCFYSSLQVKSGEYEN